MRGGIIAGAALLVALAGCSGGGGDDEETDLIGPDRSYAKAVQIGEEQSNEISGILDAEDYTAWVDMPASGNGTYRGVIAGWAMAGEPIDYVADLELRVNFDDAAVRGTVQNMVTDHASDFEHPEGTVRLTGYLTPDEFDTGIMVIGGSGTLETAGAAATVVVDGAGDFVGTDGRGILGAHETDFVWTRGSWAGTTSFSDGVFSAERE
jgi:hypothetical protein